MAGYRQVFLARGSARKEVRRLLDRLKVFGEIRYTETRVWRTSTFVIESDKQNHDTIEVWYAMKQREWERR